jgi:hypothetical protein
VFWAAFVRPFWLPIEEFEGLVRRGNHVSLAHLFLFDLGLPSGFPKFGTGASWSRGL